MAITRKKNLKSNSDRSWRNLVSDKRRRPMSSVAWRRSFLGVGKVLLIITLLGGSGYGIWLVREHFQRNPGPVDLTGPTLPVDSVKYATDGVLSLNSIKRMLQIPENATLMDLELKDIRSKLERDPQIAFARVRRRFPSTLQVEITEHKPLYRLFIRAKKGIPEMWLVSGTGVIYKGKDFRNATLSALPYLNPDPGLLKKDERNDYQRIPVLEKVSPLLEIARSDFPELYREWKVVSFLRPDADESDPGAHILIESKGVKEMRFAPRNYRAQLRRLKYLLLEPGFQNNKSIDSIDLSHGRSVFARL
jgi:hypothetical protein